MVVKNCRILRATVQMHKAHIAEKIDNKSRREWLRYARTKGWLTVE